MLGTSVKERKDVCRQMQHPSSRQIISNQEETCTPLDTFNSRLDFVCVGMVSSVKRDFGLVDVPHGVLEHVPFYSPSQVLHMWRPPR